LFILEPRRQTLIRRIPWWFEERPDDYSSIDALRWVSCDDLTAFSMCLVMLTRNDAQWIICMLCIEKAHMDVSLMMDALSEMKGCSEICSCFSLCSILFNLSRFRFQCFRKSVFLWCALLSKNSIKESNIIKHTFC